MKKVFVIVMLVLAAGLSFGQSGWTGRQNYQDGKYPQMQKGDSVATMVYVVGETYDNIYTKNSTIGTATDSSVFAFTPRLLSFKSDNTTGDTLWFSNSSTFPVTSTMAMASDEWFSLPLSWVRVYYKANGSDKKYRLRVLY